MMDFLARAAPPEVILTSRHDWVRYRPFLCRPDLTECNVGAEGTVVGLTLTNIKKKDFTSKMWTSSSTQLGD